MGGGTATGAALAGVIGHGLNSGSAYVFVRDAAGVWTQGPKLLAPDGAEGDLFGKSVALNGDTAVVGAYRDDDNGLFFGSAYVFAPDAGGLWTQQSKLLASDGALGDFFGGAVAVSGNTVVVGAALDDDNGFNAGSAYLFTAGPAIACPGDTDGDGTVGITDFLNLLGPGVRAPRPRRTARPTLTATASSTSSISLPFLRHGARARNASRFVSMPATSPERLMSWGQVTVAMITLGLFSGPGDGMLDTCV